MARITKKMNEYVIGTFDIRDIDKVINGEIKLTPGIYLVSSSGSFYADWTGNELISPTPLESEIRFAHDRMTDPNATKRKSKVWVS